MTVQDRIPERLGPYQLLRRLGEGGMGVVYLASDPAGRMVAVKALRSDVSAEPTARRRLAREVEMMLRVRSPFVAEVIDADVTADPPYIVTRHVPGRTLDDIVGAQGPLRGTELIWLASGLAAALAAVHAAGVMHRDLKPGNVMLVSGQPVVIDFGIAQAPESAQLTVTGMVMGTPGYLAPEVIEGKPVSPAADVHSWGATVAYAATGRPPFGTGSVDTTFYRIMHGEPDLDQLPPGLMPLVARALARDPARRPAAGELSVLAAALDPSGVAAAVWTASRPRAAADPPGAAAPGPPRLPRPPTVRATAAGPDPAMARSPAAAPADVRDLLPPVDYGQAPAPPAVPAPPAAPAAPMPPVQAGGPAGLPEPAERAGSGAARAPVARSAWNPLVLGAVGAGIAVSIALPLAGTAVALASLVMLRAGDLTGHALARRRIRRAGRGASGISVASATSGGSGSLGDSGGPGARGGSALVASAFFPLALARSVLRFALLSPLGLVLAGLAAVITIISGPPHPLPRAFGYAAGALVACYGLGPGSGSSRRSLGRILGSCTRTPGATAATSIVILALALIAVGTAVTHQPVYWPVRDLTAQLARVPGLHTVLAEIRRSGLRLASRIGL